ncbi:TlpA family protein disulfide reductase [Winogradskyella ludwigii]|uniref:TlpA family protein disulfide reductase n=1 Tax=Winogradskyella ludwigii TaxID=2686076 RepID=UPI0015CACED4|nr:TlpA disulfide reductase family protein [Winogradskyella ludwigii]
MTEPKKNKAKFYNIMAIVAIALFIIPQTRTPIQVLLHKGLSYINGSSLIDKEDQENVANVSWELLSETNEHFDLKDTKGKVVLINFWATWCPPCIAEMPSLQELYNDYNDKVIFLFVTNEDFETVNTFKLKKAFNFDVYQPISAPPEVLTTRSIPKTFIIDKRGAIVVEESGAVNWNSETVRNQLDDLISE